MSNGTDLNCTMTNPRDFEVTDIILKSSSELHKVPPVSGDSGIYKGQVVVNHGQSSPDYVGSSAGIFLRVGPQELESPGDSIIRIGPAYVTEDSVTTNQPGINFIGEDERLNQTGQIWFRKTDKAFFLNDGLLWQRLTPVPASQTTAGISRFATALEAALGESSTTAISPATLKDWKENFEFIERNRSGIQIYVDSELGTDDLSNDGLDPYNPFLTIERALMEVAARSYLPGLNNDLYDVFSINIAAGDYTIDNRPGTSDYRTLTRLNLNSTGPALAYTIPNPVIEYSSLLSRIRITSPSTQGVRVGQELFSSSGGVAVVKAISGNFVFLKRVRGLWAAGDFVSYANYSLINPPTGGVVVPRGCSLVAIDLRKTKVRPLYVGDITSANADPNCGGTGRTSFFKLTGGCYLYGFTFTDSLTYFKSHHLCSCVEFASTAELSDVNYSLYAKIFQVFGKRYSPEISLTDFNPVLAETEIVTSTESNTSVDSLGYLIVDSVISSSPYVYNCSLRSRLGLNGMLIDGNKVTGLRSMVTAQFTNVSLQSDQDAFVVDTTLPGNKRYKPNWKHTAFKAINGGYAQIVSCFVICSANHYETVDGGELSITNSCSNFGEYSLVSKGYSSEALPQDTGGFITSVRPPKPIDPTVLIIPAVTFQATPTTASRVYVNGDIDDERITPFKFLPGEKIFVKGADGTEYSADLVSTQPIIQQDSGGWFFSTSSVANGIFNNKTVLDDFVIYIKRVPDFRDPDDRIYWLTVQGLNLSNLRRPVENFILRLNSTLQGRQLESTLFVARVRSTDTSGAALPPGVFDIAILSANGRNESLDDLYPELNVDAPEENSASSLTYISTSTFLRDLGWTPSQITSTLQVSNSPIDLNTTVFVQFNRPSLIRCSSHTWEWQGYLNYASALPKFQDVVLSFQQSVARIKDQTFGGRVYNTGMDQDGNYLIGDKLIDLKTGEEVSINKRFTENSKVYERLTVTKKLLLFPGASLDLRSSIISVDSQTRFSARIPAENGYRIYATKDSAGLIELAESAEVFAGLDDIRAVTSKSLKELLTAIQAAYAAAFETVQLTATNATFSSLTTTGSTTLTGGVTLGSDLTVAGSTTLTENVTLSSDLNVAGTSTLTGAVTLGTDLTVTGTSTLTGSVTLGTDLSVTGSSTLTGSVTLSSDLSVQDDVSLSSNLDVAGNVVVQGSFLSAATFEDDLTINENLLVSGGATFSSNVIFNGLILGEPTFDPLYYTNFRYATQTETGLSQFATQDIVRSVWTGSPSPLADKRALTPKDLADEFAFREVVTESRLIEKGLEKVDILTFASLRNATKSVVNLRLSLSASVSTPFATQGASGTLYIHPYQGNEVALFNNERDSWLAIPRTVGTQAISLAGLAANTNFDIYLLNNGTPSSPSLIAEFVPWVNNLTPPSRFLFDGVYVKGTSDSERVKRLMGSIRTTSAGTSEFSLGGVITPAIPPESTFFPKLYLHNLYNQLETTARYDFNGGWDEENTPGVDWLHPPNYGAQSKISMLFTTSQLVSAAASIYTNATFGRAYVGMALNTDPPGINGVPSPDVSYGTAPEINGVDMSTLAKWAKVTHAGLAELFYVYRYKVTDTGGIEANVNEHAGHGIVLQTKM